MRDWEWWDRFLSFQCYGGGNRLTCQPSRVEFQTSERLYLKKEHGTGDICLWERYLLSRTHTVGREDFSKLLSDLYTYPVAHVLPDTHNKSKQ